MQGQWKTRTRNLAIIAALLLPGGCIALLAVALIKRMRTGSAPRAVA